jgi:hypothetical protein
MPGAVISRDTMSLKARIVEGAELVVEELGAKPGVVMA